MLIKKLLKRLVLPHTYSEEAYINYLRSKHVIIGEHVKIWSPNHTHIDDTKPYLIRIGDYCKITENVTILAHDYSHSVLRRTFGEYRGGTLPVQIGNNVFIGMNSTILMGTTIGNNCIVGANSLVKGSFPDNSVICGNPARIICSIEDMWEKTSFNWFEDAKRTAIAIAKNKGDKPSIEEMSDAFVWLYLPRTEKLVEKYKAFFDLSGDDYNEIKSRFLNSTPMFSSFEEFLEACELEGDK